MRRSVRAALAVGGGCLVYVGLASLLPEASPPGPMATTAAPSQCVEEHLEPGHACALDAKGMLKRFREAIRDKGAVHRTVAIPSGGEAVAGQVIVGLRPAAFHGQALAELAARQGLQLKRALPRLKQALLVWSGPKRLAQVLEQLRREPLVRYAEPNVVARVALRPNDPFLPTAGQRSANLEAAWSLTTGDANVLVAVLDTGVDPTHPDLNTRLLPGYDFVNQTAAMRDDNGHGTAMAGIIGARGQNQRGCVGIAFGCRIVPVKVADANGRASVADVAAGIDYAVQRNVRVINLSMGARVGSQALKDAVDRALAAGIVVVASAGNEPLHHEMVPAAYPGVVSATVTSREGALGYDAVVASGVDVGAPGEELITTLPGEVYCFVSGSSAAAAYASGVAALCAARDPTLTGAQIANVLRHSQDPITALKGLERSYRFGALNPLRAVRRARAGAVDLAISDVRLYPSSPLPGQAATLVVEVSNEGNVPLTQQVVRAELLQAGTALKREIGAGVVDLAMGERKELRLPFTAPQAGSRWTARVIATPPSGDVEPSDGERNLSLTLASGSPAPDLRIVSRSITTPDVAQGQVTATVVVENRGNAAAPRVTLSAATLPAGPTLSGTATPLGQPAVLPGLAVGGQASATFTYTIPSPTPTGIVRLRVAAQPLSNEVATADNQAYLDFKLGSAGQLRGLYQASNGVDVIPDAAWRVDPNRTYVPVQVFVPSKGGLTTSTRLRVTRTTISANDTPGGGTPVYEDTRGAAPTVSPAGLVIVDEMGNARPRPDLFGDNDLSMNGHHDIVRLPRSALGIPAVPAAPVVKFLDVKVEWEQQRVLFFVFSSTRSGSHRSVPRVTFSSSSFPSLPGDNHYHDVHHHTIAEWNFGSPIDIFAPRKAYGGPLQMVFECAYAMGVIASPTAAAAKDRIISTDHNSFNNRTIPDPDGPNHRPPFGPQSVANNPGVGQLEAYRNVLGITAGEEIAFAQMIPANFNTGIAAVNQILTFLPGLPIGAHMLLYRADHVEGPWHGGLTNFLVSPNNPNIKVDLGALLNDVAKNRQQRQGGAFSYASHPFSSMGWSDSNARAMFGLDPALRTKNEVHDASGKFVLKGLEFFNGRSDRTLPNSAVNFNDLNPWANASFARGRTWDRGLWRDMTRWHEFIAQTLEYSFTSDPQVRFVRKIYQAGGSDAHGDFNFAVSRTATPLNIQSTYKVNSGAWYDVRTYCLGGGKAGATAQERWLNAYADGNTLVTDGPLVQFSVDANGKFDSANLRWHDQREVHEDADGRIGGNGPLDGGYTALVARGSAAPIFGYRYTSSAEFGQIAAVLLYKTEAGAKNPTRTRGTTNTYEQIVGVNTLALGGADTDLTQPLDPAKEGPVTKITAFAMGAYTGVNPDQADMGPDDRRCWTNPVFAVPYDVTIDVNQVDPASATIPAGALTVEYRFDVSMDPSRYTIDVKSLDQSGESTGRTEAALSELVPASGSGWSDQPGIKGSVLRVVNQDPIPVSGQEYPAAGQASFVVYWRDAPRDAAGNALNPIAASFSTTHHAAPPGSIAPSTSSTAAGSTAASTGGRRSRGGACALAAPTGRSPLGGLPLLLLLVLLLRRRPQE